MYVDDEEILRMLAEDVFKSESVQNQLGEISLIICKNGTEAIAYLEGPEGPTLDLLITDRQMPGGIDGYSVARAAKRFPNLPVIMATGAPEENAGQMARLHGLRAYLVKPFKIEELVETVKGCLFLANAPALTAA